MSLEKRAGNQVSNEVVGQLTGPQKEELSLIGMSILSARKLNPQDPQHIAQVQDVLEECIFRGLKVQGRAWFSADEELASVFEAGLSQREGVVNYLNKISSEVKSHNFITTDERQQISSISPLAADFSGADQLHVELRDRQAAIVRFHQVLFEESNLAREAEPLRKSLDTIINPGKASQKDKDWVKNDMLYANLLANLALYQRVSLGLEPKDIAVLSDLWQDKTVREARQAELVSKMEHLARSSGISDKHIRIYTKVIMENMNMVLGGGKVTLQTLRNSELFAITDTDLQEEGLELKEAGNQKQVSYFSEKDLAKARSAPAKISKMLEKISELSSLRGDQLQEFVDKEYEPYLKQLSPLDLIFTYYEWEKGKLPDFTVLEEELQDLISLDTYLQALTLLQASEYKVTETNEDIIEFREGKSIVYPALTERVLTDLLQENFTEDLGFEDIIKRLPSSVLSSYLEKVEPFSLDRAHLDFLMDLGTEKWLEIARMNDVYAETDSSKSGILELVFDQDAEFLRDYINRLPLDKQRLIARNLQQIITF